MSTELPSRMLCYCEVDDSSAEVPDNLLAVLLRLRHSCNPDFETLYPLVVRWYLEIDDSESRTLREIGLDAAGRPIVFGPFGRNDGLWTGLSFGVRSRDNKPIESCEFDQAWKALESIYRDKVQPKRTAPRLPVSHRDDIAGRWSVDILHGPGAMSDQVLSLRPDGVGFFEDYNVVLNYYEEFRWEVLAPGRLAIRDITGFVVEDIVATRCPSRCEFAEVLAETQVHYSGSGQSIEVLYVSARDESLGWHAGTFGRIGSLTANYRPELRPWPTPNAE